MQVFIHELNSFQSQENAKQTGTLEYSWIAVGHQVAEATSFTDANKHNLHWFQQGSVERLQYNQTWGRDPLPSYFQVLS